MTMTFPVSGPRFSGLKLTQIFESPHLSKEFSLRFVDTTPPGQVDVYEGNSRPPVATFYNMTVERFSNKIAKGMIPTRRSTYQAIASAIESPDMPEHIKGKFREGLRNAKFIVKLTHKIWNHGKYVGTGYYGPDGRLKGTHCYPNVPSSWDPSRYKRFNVPGELGDNMYVAFDTSSGYSGGGVNDSIYFQC